MEQLLLFLLFVAVALGNYLLRWFKSRPEPPATEKHGRPEPVMLPPGARSLGEADTAERVALPPRLAAKRPSTATGPLAPSSIGPARRARRARVDRPLDLRKAIVLMAILGPCRGVERDDTPRREHQR
jgi:hypothetical protein